MQTEYQEDCSLQMGWGVFYDRLLGCANSILTPSDLAACSSSDMSAVVGSVAPFS